MTVAVTATPEPAASPPRIRLDVVASGATPPGVVHVTRTAAGVRREVRTQAGTLLDLTPSAGGTLTGLAYDYEAPYGVAAVYSTREDPATTAAPVTLAPARPWLIRPGRPALSCPLKVVALGARTRDVTEGEHVVLGRPEPVVITDGVRRTADSVLVVRTYTLPDAAALNALLADAAPLLLNVPADRGWGAVTEYVAVGRVVERRVVERDGTHPGRLFELPYRVVTEPVGGVVTARSYADLLAEAASYDALEARYASYGAVEAGA